MSGSKKGEKRGAAGRKRRAEGIAPPRASKRHRSVTLPAKGSEQYMREIAAMVLGGSSRVLPKDQMIKALRYFDDQAEDLLAMKQGLKKQLLDIDPAATDPEVLKLRRYERPARLLNNSCPT